MAMMALMKSLELLGRERPVVARERSRGAYGAVEYLLAKFCTELPLDAAFAAGFGALLHWRVGLRLPRGALVGTLALTAAACASLGLALGALAPSADAALALGVGLMVVYMVLGVINPAGMSSRPPSALVRLGGHLSPIKWSIRALCCAELRGLALEPASLGGAPKLGGLAFITSGDQALERLGLGEETAIDASSKLARLLTLQLAVALLGLRCRRPRFQSMKEPTRMPLSLD